MKLKNLITETVDQAKAQKDMMSQLKKFGLGKEWNWKKIN